MTVNSQCHQPVSCVLCQKTFIKGIMSLVQHSCYSTQDRQQSYRKLSETNRKKAFLSGLVKWRTYYQNPVKCNHCDLDLDWFTKRNKFCSSSCSAKHNNKNRTRSIESKNKTSSSMKLYHRIASIGQKSTKNISQTPKSKNKISKSSNQRVKKLKPHTKKSEIVGPYTRVYLCTCKISGKQWYSITKKTVHPSVTQTKNQYAYQCRFNFSISQYTDWFVGASELIKQYGWYSTPGSRKGIKNTNGVSRDHMYSVSDGFKNNIDPKILSHPANCRLVTHTDNQRKNSKSSITLEELLQHIQQFESIYGSS